MTQLLKPIIEKKEYFRNIQKEIEFYLYDLIYKDIVEFLRANLHIKLQNEKTTSLKVALLNNKVMYVDGHFVGKFNASISKELIKMGAIFSKRRVGYKIDLIKIPIDVREAIATGATKIAEYRTNIRKILDNVDTNADQLTFNFDFENQIDTMFKSLDIQFAETTAGSLEVSPEITKGIRRALTEKFHENMQLSIKDWQDSAIVKLRTKVEKNVMEGLRADTLETIIVNEFQASRKKAKFLAMQETSLLVSKFREERYKEAGVGKYKWSTSGDGRVRDTHKKLNGHIYTWDSPPMTNERGDRNHPGEDFGCRCVPIPIVD